MMPFTTSTHGRRTVLLPNLAPAAAPRKQRRRQPTSAFNQMRASTQYLRYQGYRSTPVLWKGELLPSAPQISLAPGSGPPENQGLPRRLGKMVEAYLYHDLRQTPGIDWIADGLQIQENRRTVGEIDALYFEKGTPVHLEVAYKFYLHEALENPREPLDCWVGPNRKDTLGRKLKKLRTHQLPLLHHPATAPYLAAYGLRAEEIEQRVCCLGQLFLPYGQPVIDMAPLNPECIAGFHLPFAQLEALSDRQFYLPQKLDWLVKPHPAVAWLAYAEMLELLETEMAHGRSPMLWWRDSRGILGRCFVRGEGKLRV